MQFISVVITDGDVLMIHHSDVVSAESYEYHLKAQGYRSQAYGSINNGPYVIVFFKENQS